ncbi:protein Skeletor: isoforms B/C-like protein, partial [Leptotrombidium deliense]
FTYDGYAANSTFWGGTTEQPKAKGFTIPDYLGRTLGLQVHEKQNVLLKMPNSQKIKDIKWIAVWSQQVTENFGKLPNFAHDVYADAVIFKDAKTLEIKGLRYDGAAPDTYFLVGTGDKPHNRGTKVPDENGSTGVLKAYRNQDVTIRLPGDLTIANTDWFAIYCIAYSENLGHVIIPKNVKDKVPADLYE